MYLLFNGEKTRPRLLKKTLFSLKHQTLNLCMSAKFQFLAPVV